MITEVKRHVAARARHADNDPLNKTDRLGLQPCDQARCVLEQAKYFHEYECQGGVSMDATNALGPLYYHCGIYSVGRSEFSPFVGQVRSGPYSEDSPVDLGIVAVRTSSYGGYGPEWQTQSSLLMHANKSGPFLYRYTPYTPRMSGAIAIVDLMGLVGASDVVNAEAHSYRIIALMAHQHLMPPEIARRYHDGETLIFVQKVAERAVCWGGTLVTVGPSPPLLQYGDGPRQDCRAVRLH